MKRQLYLLLFIGTTILLAFSLEAQNGQNDVQFSLKRWDFAAKKAVVQVQIKAHDTTPTSCIVDM